MDKEIRFVPIDDRVIVKLDEKKEKSDGGIFIPEEYRDRAITGTVMAVGQGRTTEKGVKVKSILEYGMRIVVGKYKGTEIFIDGKPFWVFREGDVLGILS